MQPWNSSKSQWVSFILSNATMIMSTAYSHSPPPPHTHHSCRARKVLAVQPDTTATVLVHRTACPARAVRKGREFCSLAVALTTQCVRSAVQGLHTLTSLAWEESVSTAHSVVQVKLRYQLAQGQKTPSVESVHLPTSSTLTTPVEVSVRSVPSVLRTG